MKDNKPDCDSEKPKRKCKYKYNAEIGTLRKHTKNTVSGRHPRAILRWSILIQDGEGYRKWVRLHRQNWIKVHGEPPAGWRVCYREQPPDDPPDTHWDDVSNLYLGNGHGGDITHLAKVFAKRRVRNQKKAVKKSNNLRKQIRDAIRAATFDFVRTNRVFYAIDKESKIIYLHAGRSRKKALAAVGGWVKDGGGATDIIRGDQIDDHVDQSWRRNAWRAEEKAENEKETKADPDPID